MFLQTKRERESEGEGGRGVEEEKEKKGGGEENKDGGGLSRRPLVFVNTTATATLQSTLGKPPSQDALSGANIASGQCSWEAAG